MTRVYFPLIFIIDSLSLIFGCKPAPSEKTIRDAIIKHFESRNYIVRELVIAEVQPIDASEKRYMGSDTHRIYIDTIRLEFTQDVGSPFMYKRGQTVTFKSGVIKLREDMQNKGNWIVVNISGIAVP